MGTDPYSFPDIDRCRYIVRPFLRLSAMVDRRQHDLRPDQRAVPDIDPALILKMASAVDKNIFADVDIFPTVRIKRGTSETIRLWGPLVSFSIRVRISSGS